MEDVVMAWSGGKDSALALREIQQANVFRVAALLTTVTGDYDRVSMHGVRRELLRRQAQALGIPALEVVISKDASEETYRAAMREVLAAQRQAGVTGVVFGDLHLEWVRDYRLKNLAEVNMQAVFPLWGRDTGALAETFIGAGFRAVITCVDTQQLDLPLAGRLYDRDLLAQLPAGVDPCGENGEFHSFVFDGPNFRRPVRFRIGETVLRDDRFLFCDLLPPSP